MLVKKYGNRRLYDTTESRYITLDELTDRIRDGEEARVVDAKTGQDLTQLTLTQVIIETRGAGHLLPVPLLHQLIRLKDDALAEFLGRYVTWALEMYLQAKQGMQMFSPFSPFAALSPFGGRSPAPPPPAAAPGDELGAMRRELDDMKRLLRKRKK
jgi:polyhydroxyalkanoate synthesis repressor PhaR